MYIRNFNELADILLEEIFQNEKEKAINPESAEVTTKQSTTCNCKKSPEIPVITKYRTFNDKVVITWFSDGTKEKAICHELDTFDVETGLTVCLVKKMCGGSSTFNNTIRKAIKIHEKEEREIDKIKRQKDSKKQKEIQNKKIVPSKMPEYVKKDKKCRAVLDLIADLTDEK